MIYCIILIFVIFSHDKLSGGFSSALKRNWKKGIGIGIDKKELELELESLFFIPKELELELNVKELELELNWKKGIDPSPVTSYTKMTVIQQVKIAEVFFNREK